MIPKWTDSYVGLTTDSSGPIWHCVNGFDLGKIVADLVTSFPASGHNCSTAYLICLNAGELWA